jgi:hypothetical protein
MKKYFCDRCGLEFPYLIDETRGDYHEVCYGCKTDLDALDAWALYVKQAGQNLNGGAA